MVKGIARQCEKKGYLSYDQTKGDFGFIGICSLGDLLVMPRNHTDAMLIYQAKTPQESECIRVGEMDKKSMDSRGVTWSKQVELTTHLTA